LDTVLEEVRKSIVCQCLIEQGGSQFEAFLRKAVNVDSSNLSPRPLLISESSGIYSTPHDLNFHDGQLRLNVWERVDWAMVSAITKAFGLCADGGIPVFNIANTMTFASDER
jgi:hypothetical protein